MDWYIGLIDGTTGRYGITFPDLPGCTAMGVTVAGTIANGTDAMRLWMEVAEERGERVKEPTALETLRADPHVAAELRRGNAAVLVPVAKRFVRVEAP